jgi:asparagine synthase (glutamine-hydrolysing)
MCGIAGIFNYNGQRVDEELLRGMTRLLAHRGPDDEGAYINNGPRCSIGLGHRRLSIIDLSNAGHQPMSNEDETIWIVLNGEIYNFKELRQELLTKGHHFRSKTDTETVIHLYEEEKEHFVNRLNGMFALAIWDSHINALVLARDRVGKKPLYYAFSNNQLLFASEIKSILLNKGIDRDIDFEALDDYFTFQCIAAPKTIFKKIRKVRPGHILMCSAGKVKEEEYWDVRFDRLDGESEDNYRQKLLCMVEDAVRCRLESDVPLGAFLSGGVDSSVVVAVMSEIAKKPVITASIGFHDKRFNELDFSHLVAQQYNTIHHEHIVEPNVLEMVKKFIGYFDEPFADASSIPTYYVSEMTRRHVTVALSGDGGDEVFAGYRRYYYDRLENKLRAIPEFLRRYIIGTAAKIYPKGDWMPRFLRAKTLLTNLSLPAAKGYMNTRSTIKYDMKNALYSKELKTKIGAYDPFFVLDYYFKRARTDDPLSRIQYVDIKTYLTDDILTKVDRMSMANSLEVRSPLLDYRLIEFVATMPSSLKLKGRESKYILKKSVKSKLPPQILKRKKMGFAVPIEQWLRKEIKQIAREILFSSQTISRGYFNQKYIEKIWNAHMSGQRNNSTQLWCLLIFELWHRNYIDMVN